MLFDDYVVVIVVEWCVVLLMKKVGDGVYVMNNGGRTYIISEQMHDGC